jgi:hypothetical protein
LKHPHQVDDWLQELGGRLSQSGGLTLIGSGALLWHAHQRGLTVPLSENSMDVDPITDSDEIARLCYEALIGSEFEMQHGWHVNLMPQAVLSEFPEDWQDRATTRTYGLLTVTVPSPSDLMVPKRRRNEPRDRAHEAWAQGLGLIP